MEETTESAQQQPNSSGSYSKPDANALVACNALAKAINESEDPLTIHTLALVVVAFAGVDLVRVVMQLLKEANPAEVAN